MARFFFQIATVNDFIPDYEGVELEDVTACHGHAVKIVRECIPHIRSDLRRWWIEITDRSGARVLTVLFPRHPPFGLRPSEPVPDVRCG